MRTDKQTEIKNSVDVLRSFSEAPNNTTLLTVSYSLLQSVHTVIHALPFLVTIIPPLFDESRTCGSS